jgi:aminoglycoside phosphotransferase (APT) family kinase protein
MQISDLIRYINQRHGTAFELDRKLPGGYQDGAYCMVDPAGRTVVLKQMYALRAVPIMQRLRAIGYPTPGVLHAGTAADGTPYLVQELLPGAPLAVLAEGYLDQIFALNDLQADLNPTGTAYLDESWSRYARDIVYANESGWGHRLRAYSPQTGALLDAIEHAMRPYEDVVLPDTDVVHGDFHTDNILVQDGQVTGVIDMTYAGYGTRAIDLATLLHFAYAGDYAPGVRERLRARAIQIAGPTVCAICLAYRAIAMVDWPIRHAQPEVVDRFVRTGWVILEDLRRFK